MRMFHWTVYTAQYVSLHYKGITGVDDCFDKSMVVFVRVFLRTKYFLTISNGAILIVNLAQKFHSSEGC